MNRDRSHVHEELANKKKSYIIFLYVCFYLVIAWIVVDNVVFCFLGMLFLDWGFGSFFE